MNATELRALGTEELRQRLIQTKEDLFHLKLRQRTTKLENPMKLAQTRREISRVLTLLCEREIEERRRSRG